MWLSLNFVECSLVPCLPEDFAAIIYHLRGPWIYKSATWKKGGRRTRCIDTQLGSSRGQTSGLEIINKARRGLNGRYGFTSYVELTPTIWIICSLIKKVYRGPNNTSLPGRSSKSFAVFSRANEQAGVRYVYSGLIEPAQRVSLYSRVLSLLWFPSPSVSLHSPFRSPSLSLPLMPPLSLSPFFRGRIVKS